MADYYSSRLRVDRKTLQRIFSKIEISTENFHKGVPCWEWQGCLHDNGYGRIRVNGQRYLIHRVFFTLFVSEIPSTLYCDHLCRVRHCVNPIHIEAVTPKENVLRGINPMANNAKKTHCIQGHLLQGSNVAYVTYNGTKKERRCRICTRETHHRIYQQKTEHLNLITNAQKTHCPRGHSYSGDNLIIRRNARECRECKKLHCKNSYKRKTAKTNIATLTER